jgi:hypothetical protein
MWFYLLTSPKLTPSINYNFHHHKISTTTKTKHDSEFNPIYSNSFQNSNNNNKAIRFLKQNKKNKLTDKINKNNKNNFVCYLTGEEFDWVANRPLFKSFDLIKREQYTQHLVSIDKKKKNDII